jgi:hypothetical protein
MVRRRGGRRRHRSILQGIARLSNPNHRMERQTLIVDGHDEPPVDRQSWEHLVTFLDRHDSHEVTELRLQNLELAQPSDGGLEVLCTFFSRSDTSLTKVALRKRNNFGGEEGTSQLISAFETNRTVTELIYSGVKGHLNGAALGTQLSCLMQSMPQLQRLDCFLSHTMHVEGVMALQPALQGNRTLRKLSLCLCGIKDEGIRLVAEALVGNAILEMLDIRINGMTSAALDYITQMIESTQLKTVYFAHRGVFNDADTTNRFVSTLQHQASNVQDLPRIRRCLFPGDEGHKTAMVTIVQNSLARNEQLNRLHLFLAPQPSPPPQPGSTLLMMKLSHKIIIKFAMVPNNAGASAIFKLYRSRPALLEKRLLSRQAAVAAPVSHKRKRL